ncbi:hypothetical protein KSS87_008483 [Heliosperma pusillum]|nr:hypothetical protein KSS87_008483 [Heliosperma pusillum]
MMSRCSVLGYTPFFPITIPSYSLTSSGFHFHGERLPSPSPRLSHAILPSYIKRELILEKSLSCGCNSSTMAEVVEDGDAEFIVVNFYHFALIQDPHLEVATHSSFIQGLDIHGRIYFNEQGVNAQFSGPSKDALTYVDWVREDQRFTDILVQISPSSNGHAFPRLKLRYKPSLVQFDLGAQNLPLLEPLMRATPLTPVEWRRKLNALHNSDDDANKDQNKSCILLDVRNGYEWDIGHFDGAQRPEVDSFKSTSFGLSDVEVVDSDPLLNVDRDKTDILMYCTGGIRCDVYSTILRQKGFKNLYTLKGGVSHYLEKEGPEKWIGNLFVFDSRLSLPPSTFKPGVVTSSRGGDAAHSKYARCYICGSQVSDTSGVRLVRNQLYPLIIQQHLPSSPTISMLATQPSIQHSSHSTLLRMGGVTGCYGADAVGWHHRNGEGGMWSISLV